MMCSGETWSTSTCRRARRTRTVVFPEPGPATISSGFAGSWARQARCSLFGWRAAPRTNRTSWRNWSTVTRPYPNQPRFYTIFPWATRSCCVRMTAPCLSVRRPRHQIGPRDEPCRETKDHTYAPRIATVRITRCCRPAAGAGSGGPPHRFALVCMGSHAAFLNVSGGQKVAASP
jgi:hypothetical protein